MKRFSVIVINFNKNGYLQTVIARIKALAKKAEFILADDHSNDGSFKWAEKSGLFDNFYRKPIRERYCLCTVRNEGIKLATRPYVVLLDADCLPEREYFISLIRLLEIWKDNCPNVAVGFTDQYNKDGSEILLEDHRKSYLDKKGLCKMGWRDSFGGNICFPVSLWKTVGGFDEEFNGYWGYEDLDFAIKCVKAKARIYGMKGILVRHLQHPLNKEFEQSNLYGRNWKLLCSKHPNVV